MQHDLHIYNSMTRTVERFVPINEPFVGMYVCGPTVYSDAHLGHARPAVTFDILYRWLRQLGYSVRYVRNITDVGHLEDEQTDSGEDKIAKKARQERLEPMEVVQKYTNTFHRNMRQLNTLPPSIEPRATGHIIEQQQMIKSIMQAGYAYEVNGSVYFDLEKYNSKFKNYGTLSGRNLEEQQGSRELEGSTEKRSPFDFALWKKATPSHIMQWPSEWSSGYPGWHLECSAMSVKYLGEKFDIHGGGMDLRFPHHECEIAQSCAALGEESVRYWVHNNMITINGQKMARSLGNFITLDQLFSGDHELLDKAYSPMTIRFFILQAHYRSMVDFSPGALEGAARGLQKLMAAASAADDISPSAGSSAGVDISTLRQRCYEAMNEDLATPRVIAALFDAARIVNGVSAGNITLDAGDTEQLKELFSTWMDDVLGLVPDMANLTSTSEGDTSGSSASEGNREAALIEIILNLRQEAREQKDWARSDQLRDRLAKLGVIVKDSKDGASYELGVE